MQCSHDLSSAQQRLALYALCIELPHHSAPGSTSFVSIQCVPRALRLGCASSPSLWFGDPSSEYEHSYGAAVTDVDPPDELCCPISHCVMSDPVLASDGHFYELSSLFSWLDSVAGRPGSACTPRSPLTNERLHHLVFRVGAKREEIDRWVVASGSGHCVSAWDDAYVRNVIGVYLGELRRVKRDAHDRTHPGCPILDRMGRLFFLLFSDKSFLCNLDLFEARTHGQISVKRYSYMQAIARLDACRSGVSPGSAAIRQVGGSFTPAWLRLEMRFFGFPAA